MNYPLDVVLDHYPQAAVDRIATQRALVSQGLLKVSRRSITLPLKQLNWQRLCRGHTPELPLIACCLAFCIPGCSFRLLDLHASNYAHRINNDQVEWHGTYVGLSASLHGTSAAIVEAEQYECIEELLALLSDPKRFAAAHVILANIVLEEDNWTWSDQQWNGLYVSLRSDGSVRYETEPAEVVEIWRLWMARRGNDRKRSPRGKTWDGRDR